jgi:hypothetical protein
MLLYPLEFYIALPRPTSTDTYPTSIAFLIFFYHLDKKDGYTINLSFAYYLVSGDFKGINND